MFYRLIRSIVAFALGLFYRIEVRRKVQDVSGPVMFVCNHPNSLIDPALVFVLTSRQVTFLAREPLFRAPVLGLVLKGLGALPVFRKQDHPGKMEKNEGTLEAAAGALIEERAITIFPEGKSHSMPQLSDVKTGCARIALRVARAGKALRIIPIGLTYEQKQRFRSRVHIEVGDEILVSAAQVSDEAEGDWVRGLTDQVNASIREVTLNLDQWDDLEMIETADQLYALRNGFKPEDPDRLRLLAKGANILRNEQPERFDDIKDEIVSFRTRLQMLNAEAKDLSVNYRKRELSWFVVRNLASIFFGLPLFALGLALFFIPFMILRVLSMVVPLEHDRVATLKLVSALVMVPLWWTALCITGWYFGGTVGLMVALLGAMPLALFTRYFMENRRRTFEDVLTFFKLSNRTRLKQHLLYEGERLQEDIQKIVGELIPRVAPSIQASLTESE